MKTIGLFAAIGLIVALVVGVLTIEVRQRMEPFLPILPTNAQINLAETNYLIEMTALRIVKTASDAVRHLIQNRAEPGRDPP